MKVYTLIVLFVVEVLARLPGIMEDSPGEEFDCRRNLCADVVKRARMRSREVGVLIFWNPSRAGGGNRGGREGRGWFCGIV